jgi:hypothetical protein
VTGPAGRTIVVVGDVHQDMRQLDWLLERAPEPELVVLVGGLLGVSSAKQDGLLAEVLDV